MKTIEHKIVIEKDYTAPLLFGTMWVIICAALSLGTWYFFTGVLGGDFVLTRGDIIYTTVMATSVFFFGIYMGRDNFQPNEEEKVIHIIKNKKEGTK